MDWSQVANTAASAAATLASAVFVGTYAVLAPWRRTEAGRHVMAMSVVVGALGLYTVLVTVWPHGAALAVLRVVRTVLVLAVATLLVQRTRMVIRAQRGRGRR